MNPEYSYPSKKDKYYIDDKYIYLMVKNMILSYDELCKQKYSIMHGTAPISDGMPKGNNQINPMEAKLERSETISDVLNAINKVCYTMRTIHAIEKPLKAFCSYPYFSIAYSKRTKTISPCERTWIRFRNEFIFRVARKLNFV